MSARTDYAAKAAALLDHCGMAATHPDYDFCHKVLARGLSEPPSKISAFYLLRLAVVGIKSRVAHGKAVSNLKPFEATVTDEQILAIIGDDRYPTRDEQASKLGIKKRSLQARLSKLKKK